MIYIGAHLSASKGFLSMGEQALEIGADTFAFFTRNPRGGKAKKLDEADARALMELMEEHHFGKIVAHAPYTMNLCSDKTDIRRFAGDVLTEDMERMEATPGQYYNFHPGSHVGQGADEAIPMITEALNKAMFEGMTTTVLLETMAGKGTEVGRNFEEIQQIIEGVKIQDHIGVCLDTCHVWDGGYDILDNLDAVLEEFDRIIGVDRLKAVHINDSKNDQGARKDRHECIGLGQIGTDGLEAVVKHPLLQGRPFILETPNTLEGYAKEIALIRGWMEQAE